MVLKALGGVVTDQGEKSNQWEFLTKGLFQKERKTVFQSHTTSWNKLRRELVDVGKKILYNKVTLAQETKYNNYKEYEKYFIDVTFD